MFPLIALLIFLDILVGQIPGYSASGGAFSKVQDLLYPDLGAATPTYRQAIELAGELAEKLEPRKEIDRVIKMVLNNISNLRYVERQWGQGTGIQCDHDYLMYVVNARETMKISDKNEFGGAAAEHPLNKMINHLTDIMFDECSRILNSRVENLKYYLPVNREGHELQLAVINLDRFQKFLKLPESEVDHYHSSDLPISLNHDLIDENTELTPEDLHWLGLPQENNSSRDQLLHILTHRTCQKINENPSAYMLFSQGSFFILYAHDVYQQTGIDYYFRSEFVYYKACSLLTR